MAEEVVDVRPAEVADATQLLALLAQLGRESNTFTVDEGIEDLSETVMNRNKLHILMAQRPILFLLQR